MEEVPAHVHLGPIVPDVLSRQHEHISGLIWSGDHETYLIERLLGVQLSLSHFSGYKAVVHGGFGRCTTDWRGVSVSSDLGVVAYTCIAASADAEIQADPLAPLGAIWCTLFDCSHLPTHTLVTYRDQLDFMSSDQVRFTMACIVCN
ncbi:hypothetical protein M9H77_18446 [Catharanthus roseus]|uniref:Uncharacterized protein n=1 Tax=Catharanthus roseus TaxID=4058 RepID=A0ACC0B7I6_CATRO|nr:hypothetical protein M9H77_18446 [Catharanthus roseus]